MKYKDLGKKLSKEEMKHVSGGGPGPIPGCSATKCNTNDWCYSTFGTYGWNCYCSDGNGLLCHIEGGGGGDA